MNASSPLSLYELNAHVRQSLERTFPRSVWVQAELSEVRLNPSGHCFVEFVQKDERGRGLVARASGIIWREVSQVLLPYFQASTGQPFVAGIKVAVLVSVTFHEQYGYRLVVRDVDPTYTLGELALRRRQILKQLEADGVLTLNKELPMPVLPRRVAVISSPTAAGYGDFCHQLAGNPRGYPFRVELFAAVMQGERVEESILHALDAIMERMEAFDVVVIIRGGGAVADLSGFDSYQLAAGCAQFPLPIITGIGHERDDTVLDLVAHTRVKTPTAAAELLIARMDEAATALDELATRLHTAVRSALEGHRRRLTALTARIPLASSRCVSAARLWLVWLGHRLGTASRTVVAEQRHRADDCWQQLSTTAVTALSDQRHKLVLYSQRLNDNSPDRLLALGYSITLGPDGHAVRDARQLSEGDVVRTLLHRGEAISVVKACLNPTSVDKPSELP